MKMVAVRCESTRKGDKDMCIIAIKLKGQKMFDEQTIRTMFDNNPDGAGYMFHDGKKVVIRKGFMEVDTLLKSLSSQDFTNTNLVLHFRIGTSGRMDALNCHPFPVYDTNKTYCKTDIALVHNGILRDFTPSKKSPINDTQVFIQTMLRELKKGFQYDKGILKLIAYIIDTNKFALLDENNRVTMIGDFIEDNGYVYSNRSYLPKVQKAQPKKERSSSFDWLWYDEPEDDFWSELDKRYAR